MTSRGDKYKLHDRGFSTKKAVNSFLSEVRSHYEKGERVNDQDALYVLAALQFHPDRDRKVGCGIDHFVATKREHGTDCFGFIRRDETKDHFSFKKCVRQMRPTIEDSGDSAM